VLKVYIFKRHVEEVLQVDEEKNTYVEIKYSCDGSGHAFGDCDDEIHSKVNGNSETH
jgi:hypothetical protein